MWGKVHILQGQDSLLPRHPCSLVIPLWYASLGHRLQCGRQGLLSPHRGRLSWLCSEADKKWKKKLENSFSALILKRCPFEFGWGKS